MRQNQAQCIIRQQHVGADVAVPQQALICSVLITCCKTRLPSSLSYFLLSLQSASVSQAGFVLVCQNAAEVRTEMGRSLRFASVHEADIIT